MQAYSLHFVNYMRRAQEPWFWKLPELCKTSDLTQTLWHRPISKTCNNALDSLLPVSNRCSSVSVGSFLKFSLCWRKMLMYGLSSLLLLTFPFILGVLAQIFWKNCSLLTLYWAWSLLFLFQTKRGTCVPETFFHYVPLAWWKDVTSPYRLRLHVCWERKCKL